MHNLSHGTFSRRCFFGDVSHNDKGIPQQEEKRLPAHMPNAGAPCYIKQTSLDLKGRDRFQYIYKTWGLQHSAFLNGQV